MRHASAYKTPRREKTEHGGRIMVCEVCVESLAGALAAERGGADRLELCSGLALGGLTPSTGLWEVVRERVSLPIMVMIRPRAGGFCYTAEEIETMRREIRQFVSRGVQGIVFGALQGDGQVDAATVADLRQVSGSASVTFHRAFDVTPNPLAALEVLGSLGVDRILTSAQRSSVDEGLPLLAELVVRAPRNLRIVAGGGIHEGNVARIVSESGVAELHFSGRRLDASGSVPDAHRWQELTGEGVEAGAWMTDPEQVRAIVAAARVAADRRPTPTALDAP